MNASRQDGTFLEVTRGQGDTLPRRSNAKPESRWRGWSDEEGANLVEFALSCSVLMAMLFGCIQMSMALYAYHYVDDAAREASRWAMVRGASCATDLSKAYCSPSDGNATGADNGDIQAYVQSLGFPFSGNLTTSTTWLSASASTPTTWTSCGATQCNSAGNQVQVTVSLSFPIGIPFWRSATIPLASTSTLVIAQ